MCVTSEAGGAREGKCRTHRQGRLAELPCALLTVWVNWLAKPLRAQDAASWVHGELGIDIDVSLHTSDCEVVALCRVLVLPKRALFDMVKSNPNMPELAIASALLQRQKAFPFCTRRSKAGTRTFTEKGACIADGSALVGRAGRGGCAETSGVHIKIVRRGRPITRAPRDRVVPTTTRPATLLG